MNDHASRRFKRNTYSATRVDRLVSNLVRVVPELRITRRFRGIRFRHLSIVKYHTQGQRFSGAFSARALVRRTALAVAVVASGLGTYVLVVIPVVGGAVVRPTTNRNSVSQSTVGVTPRAVSAVNIEGDITKSVRTLSTSRLSTTTRGESVSTPTTTALAVTGQLTANSATSDTTPVRHIAPTARAVATRMVARTAAPPKRATSAKPVASRPAIGAATAVAAAKLATRLNPSGNIAPSPNFLQAGPCTQNGSTWSCSNPCLTSSMTWPTFTNNPGCTNFILQAIDNARAIEQLGPMTLPSNWYSLTTAQQLFVVADLERTARGLPPYLGINAVLSAEAQRAAVANQDPVVAAGFAVSNDEQGYPAMGGAWSGGFSVLAADYIWMYDDGWGGSVAATSNVVCTSSHAAGCWAHRDELIGWDPGFNPGVGLTTATCEVGVGFAVVNGSGSFVDLIEKPSSTPPAMSFTWATNVVPYL